LCRARDARALSAIEAAALARADLHCARQLRAKRRRLFPSAKRQGRRARGTDRNLMIEIDNLVFEYPSKRALDGVSARVNKGAIAALVGPNGAGKSTLLRCIAALERPYAGSVRIDGVDVQTHPRQIHARLGFLPDFYGLYDELSVRRALSFAARAHAIAPAA